MPLLLLALVALGVWGYTRPGGFRGLLSTPMPGSPATPEQIIRTDAPQLANEIIDLFRNGRNVQAMHAVATELEKDGFFEAAALLHKRADVLMGASVDPAAQDAAALAARNLRIRQNIVQIVRPVTPTVSLRDVDPNALFSQAQFVAQSPVTAVPLVQEEGQRIEPLRNLATIRRVI